MNSSPRLDPHAVIVRKRPAHRHHQPRSLAVVPPTTRRPAKQLRSFGAFRWQKARVPGFDAREQCGRPRMPSWKRPAACLQSSADVDDSHRHLIGGASRIQELVNDRVGPTATTLRREAGRPRGGLRACRPPRSEWAVDHAGIAVFIENHLPRRQPSGPSRRALTAPIPPAHVFREGLRTESI